jgi:shikimate kinase
MRITTPEEELNSYHEDRKLIDFRLSKMEEAVTRLADVLTENVKVTTELKVKVGLASAIIAAVVSAAIKMLWK